MKTEKTMEESSIDGYLEILRKYLIKNPKNLQNKLKIMIDCGKQIAKLDGKKDEIKFPRIPSCEDEENKKNNENHEKDEDEKRVKKRKLDIITAREKNERMAKSIKSKKIEQNGEKNGNPRIREKEKELSNTEIVHMQKAKSDISTLENPVTVEDIVRELVKEEVWKKYAEGYEI